MVSDMDRVGARTPAAWLLVQEGKRLLRRALAHEDEEQGSVDFSIVTNRDDASADSDLESFFEWEQQNGANGNGNSGGGGAAQKKRNHNKWKGQQYGNDVERHDDLENAMDELTEKRDATKVQALQKVINCPYGPML